MGNFQVMQLLCSSSAELLPSNLKEEGCCSVDCDNAVSNSTLNLLRLHLYKPLGVFLFYTTLKAAKVIYRCQKRSLL